MRRKFRLYLFLLIIFSFLIGMPAPAINMEIAAAGNILSPAGSVVDMIKILLLLITQLMVVLLLFIKPSPGYKYYLILFPLVYLVAYFINTAFIYYQAPVLLLSLIPFVVSYVITLSMYNKAGMIT